MKNQKPIKVGRFKLLWTEYDLFLDMSATTCGAHIPEDASSENAYVRIGAKGCGQWRMVLGGLVHELMELAFGAIDCDYSLTHWNVTSSDKIFVMTHSQFERVCEAVGYVLAMTQTDLHAAWRKQKSASKK